MRSWRDRIPRFLVTASIAATCVCAHAQSQRAAIDRYCITCHNSKAKIGGLSLDATAGNDPAEHPEIWEKVVRRLRVRSMPPAGLPRPDESGYKSLLGWIEGSLDRAAAAHPNPGRTDTFRRLNRT